MAFQAALYHSRQRRLERVRRLGLNLEADSRFTQGTNTAPVVSSADGAEFGATIMTIESLNGPPEGVLLEVAAVDVLTLNANGTVRFFGWPSLDVTVPHNMGAFGFYTFVNVWDPDNGRGDLYINGKLIASGTGVAVWSSDSGDWIYADSMTNIGQVYDGENVYRQVPGIYVP